MTVRRWGNSKGWLGDVEGEPEERVGNEGRVYGD